MSATPIPLTIRDVKRDGKTSVLVDVVDILTRKDRQPVRGRPDPGLGFAGSKTRSKTARPA